MRILRDDIREFVSPSSCKTLDDMIARYRERDFELELRLTRKPVSIQLAEGLTKKPKTFYSQARGHQGGHCRKCGKPHDGACRSGGLGSYKCREIGQISNDWPQEGRLSTLTNGAARVTAPSTLRIIDGRESRA